MKKKEQTIKCDVYDCCHCDTDCNCCILEEIKVCNCDNKKDKKSTMCNSYDKKK